MREVAFLAVLLCAVACVVVGVAHLSTAAAWVVAGVLLAAWAWFALTDPTPAEVAE